MSRQEPPATLPADFFARMEASGPPDTLPADFFDQQQPDPLDAVRAQQAAKYPTAEEISGDPSMRGSPNEQGIAGQVVNVLLEGDDPAKVQRMGFPIVDEIIGGAVTGPARMAAGVGGFMQAMKQSPAMPSSILPKGPNLPAGGIPGWIQQKARTQYGKIFNPTTRPNKTLTKRVTPQLIKRGEVIRSPEALQEASEQTVKSLGRQRGSMMRGDTGDIQVDVSPVMNALEGSKRKFKAVTEGPNGPIITRPEIVEGADELKAIVRQFGQKVSARSLDTLRQGWDEVVAEAQGFTKRTGEPLSVANKLRREATNAIRTELHKASPDLAKLDAEFTLWKRVNQVIGDTVLRREGQRTPMSEQILTGAGAAGGLASGGPMGAVSYAVTMKALARMGRSGVWRSVDAITKDRIANMLANGDVRTAALITSRLAAVLGAEQSDQ